MFETLLFLSYPKILKAVIPMIITKAEQNAKVTEKTEEKIF